MRVEKDTLGGEAAGAEVERGPRGWVCRMDGT